MEKLRSQDAGKALYVEEYLEEDLG